MISLTRVYRFSASHRLHVAGLSESENRRLFGKCNNPFGHGHDYRLSVCVGGRVDPVTGLLVSTLQLDRFVEKTVLDLFEHRNLNADLPQFRDLVPTTENLVLVIADLLERGWPACFGEQSDASLVRVRIQETERNGFELLVSDTHARPHSARKKEGLAIHA